jgi:DNA-binding NarL/FixJ family response regulator
MRILLADDHALFRKGLAGLLAAEPDFEVVGEAGTGKRVVELARDLMPDLVLMDIFMPEWNGLEATRRLKEELPYVRVVILTISEKEETLFEAVKAGAQGYLLKGIEPPELFDMLRGLGRGEAALSRSMAAKILKEFSRREPQARPEDSPLTRLTAREREVLTHITLGLSNKQVAARLGISENTVRNHLRNILEKLHLQNRVQAAAFALRHNLGVPAQPT